MTHELIEEDTDSAPGVVRRVAKACSGAGCKVSLGSHSHYPREVFRNMNTATAMVAEFDLQVV